MDIISQTKHKNNKFLIFAHLTLQKKYDMINIINLILGFEGNMSKKLKLINVNKIYKLSNKETFQALYDINVEFEKGELVSIVGESGSGKSTFMNIIGGLDSDFSGTVISDGENLKSLTDKQLDKYRKNKIGFVFQSFNLISHLSILDNVSLSLTLSNVGEKEKIARATDMLRRVGLETQLKKNPTQLSGGQKQRVAIARALINDPEIIIADEPTGALDSNTSMQILQILKEIADSGKLVIMVTHSEKVASISSRVIEISDGRIVSDRVNEKYKKSEHLILDEKPENELTKDKTSHKKDYKNKQNLSIWQAIKLSFHNMWASKIKNLLMAFGVAIGISSLIMMMCFSSGITDYITNLMKSYSDPTIATISKKSSGTDISSLFDTSSFTEEEISTLTSNINTYLEKENIDFSVNDENIEYGFTMFTLLANAKVYPTHSTDIKNDSQTIYYVYTTPPYYTQQNLLEGAMSTPPEFDENGKIKEGSGGFVFSSGIYNMFEDEDVIGQEVTISFNVPLTDGTTYPLSFTDKICGVMDTSIMSGFTVVYLDYEYLKYLFENASPNQSGSGEVLLDFAPTTLYIHTESEKITKAINSYLSTTEEYTGSIEDQLANMFKGMIDVIGTSLIIISSISLLVSAMMIMVVLYMSVSERTKEIGVLKSIGARRKDIKRIFTSESFLVGLLSGIMGIAFNLLMALIIWLALTYAIGIAPISYRWWYFAVSIGVAVIISMLAGLYPASKAAKLDPVESLRRE